MNAKAFSIQASGALLLLLETRALGSDIGRMIQKTWDPNSFVVSALRISYIKDLVCIDNVSLNGLRVFSQEAHPSSNVKGQTSSAKEGSFSFMLHIYQISFHHELAILSSTLYAF